MSNSADSRKPSPIAFLGLLALFSFFGINVIQTMTDEYSHQDKLGALEQQVSQLENQKKQLQAQLQHVKSDQFVEQEARNKLYMGKANEKVVIFPKESTVLADTVESPPASQGQQSLRLGYIGDWLSLVVNK